MAFPVLKLLSFGRLAFHAALIIGAFTAGWKTYEYFELKREKAAIGKAQQSQEDFRREQERIFEELLRDEEIIGAACDVPVDPCISDLIDRLYDN